jgi:FMN reductase
MSDLVTIAGSPSTSSRSSAVLAYVRSLVEAQGFSSHAIQVRDLPAEALLWGYADDGVIKSAIEEIEAAQVVVIATPVYKAAYTGILKTFLDLLPQRALESKVVFPIATGGSPAHQLVIDYALNPVLVALGAHRIQRGLYIQDAQLQYTDGLVFDKAIEQRLLDSVQAITYHLNQHIRSELVTTGK